MTISFQRWSPKAGISSLAGWRARYRSISGHICSQSLVKVQILSEFCRIQIETKIVLVPGECVDANQNMAHWMTPGGQSSDAMAVILADSCLPAIS
jgi:hypothetical protein